MLVQWEKRQGTGKLTNFGPIINHISNKSNMINMISTQSTRTIYRTPSHN